MKLRPLSVVVVGLMIVAMILSACAPAAAPRRLSRRRSPLNRQPLNPTRPPRPRCPVPGEQVLEARHHHQHRRLRPAR